MTTTLYLSNSSSRDHQAIWQEAVRRGWQVERIRGVTVSRRETDNIAAYLEPIYAPIISEQLGIELIDPEPGWLSELPMELVRRRIELTDVANARKRTSRFFIKPPNDKSFEAKVVADGGAIDTELDDSTPVLVADPVEFVSEYRCFVLDGHALTVSPYVRGDALASETAYAMDDDERINAIQFAERVLACGSSLPNAVVLDVGMLSDGCWAVVEANGAWGAGIYGCDPAKCLDVIDAATIVVR